MARITFDNPGGGARGHTSPSGHRGDRSGGKRRTKGTRRAGRSTGIASITSQPSHHTARLANVPATTRAPLPGGDRSPWASGAHTAGNPSPALELTGGAGLLDVMLDLAGTESASVRGVLAAWQREQDRLANRAWRRPGGLVRPAGL